MRIEYRLRYLDYVLFTVVHQFLNIPLQGMYLLFAVWLGWTWIESEPGMIGVAIGVIAYAAMWLVQILFTAIYLITRRTDGTLTDHVVELRADAFYESTKFNQSRFFWPGILRVVRRPGFVAVYVAQHLAHVVPMRAFGSRQEAEAFVAYIKERMVAV